MKALGLAPVAIKEGEQTILGAQERHGRFDLLDLGQGIKIEHLSECGTAFAFSPDGSPGLPDQISRPWMSERGTAVFQQISWGINRHLGQGQNLGHCRFGRIKTEADTFRSRAAAPKRLRPGDDL